MLLPADIQRQRETKFEKSTGSSGLAKEKGTSPASIHAGAGKVASEAYLALAFGGTRSIVTSARPLSVPATPFSTSKTLSLTTGALSFNNPVPTRNSVLTSQSVITTVPSVATLAGMSGARPAALLTTRAVALNSESLSLFLKVIGVIAACIFLIGALAWLAKKRRRIQKATMNDSDDTPQETVTLKIDQEGGVLEPFRLSIVPQRSSLKKGGQRNPAATARPSSFTVPTSPRLSSIVDATHPTEQHGTEPRTELVSDVAAQGNGNSRRRAMDGGRVSLDLGEGEEDSSTLPPDYRDVFNVSRAPTVSSGRS